MGDQVTLERTTFWSSLADNCTCHLRSDVWACVARRSATVDGEIPSEIPFALIACDEAKTVKADDMDRFVLGNVLIPKVCCESFSFNLMSSKKFGEKRVFSNLGAQVVYSCVFFRPKFNEFLISPILYG